MGNDLKTSAPRIVTGFDEALWKAGVEDGAFSGIRDKDARWYVAEVGEEKIALGNAVPGPGELTTVSYYVAPAWRNQGYGTRLARYIADQHEKASFVVKKDNEASVKVALAALREKFSATMGRHVVRLTKEAAPLSGGLAEGKPDSDFDPKALAQGKKVEMEHTDDPQRAKQIAKDHLTEYPTYYTELKKMEKRLEEKKGAEAKKESKKAGPGLGPYMHLVDDIALISRALLKKADLFGHPLGYMAGGMVGEMALGKKLPFAAPIGGAILGGQIAKRKLAPKSPSVKEAVDPVMLGLGAAATALTTAITAKQIKSQVALTEAVQKTQAAKKALIAALAGAGAAGAVGGYALGKKKPKKTERSVILQPIVVTPDEVPAKLGSEKIAIGLYDWLMRATRQPQPNPPLWQSKAMEILKPFMEWAARIPKTADDRSESIEQARRHLRGLVRPFGPLYKTKSAQGWDVLVESIATDSQASGAGK